MSADHPPKLESLPQTLPKDDAISIELVEGVPIFRATQKIQTRIESLILKHQETFLCSEEEQELSDYEALDDYLSLVNRTIRNFYTTQK